MNTASTLRLEFVLALLYPGAAHGFCCAVQIINYNLDILSLSQMSKDLAQAAQLGQQTGPVGGVDLGRSLRLWLNMQNSVNTLFDSTTAEGNAGGAQVCCLGRLLLWAIVPCSHELLSCTCLPGPLYNTSPLLADVQTGLQPLPRHGVWNHGRWAVDTACRKSQACLAAAGHPPDPGEEGGTVPQEHDGQARQLCGPLRHLARPLPRLWGDRRAPLLCRAAVRAREGDSPERPGTRPGQAVPRGLAWSCCLPGQVQSLRRVVRWILSPVAGIQGLREMVIRGPHEHPGANAVEDENGRLLNLTQMSLQASVLIPH